MPLEPVTANVLAKVAESDGSAFNEMSPVEARAFYRDNLLDLPEVEVAKVQDRLIDGPNGEIPIRIYYPQGSSAEAAPLHLQFHGGGWVIGDLETHDRDCREICSGSGCIVVAVDYRLAPEHPFPAGLEDCYAVTCWAADNRSQLGARKTPISIGGDSAGGNLAAAVAMMCRDRCDDRHNKGTPDILFQLLIYPIMDASMDSASFIENAEGYILTRDLMTWFWNHYCPDRAQRLHPYVSLAKAEDLSDLPPALIMTAEYDPLRDEGEAYAERLNAAGVDAQIRRFDGLVHGFVSQAGYIEAAREGLELVISTLRKVHEL